MRRTLEWQIQRIGFLFRTASVFLHGCVLILFLLLALFDTWNIFESLNLRVFFFLLTLMQGLGVTSIKKEPMHAAVVAYLLQSPFLSVFTLFIYLGVRFLCEVQFAVKRLVALTFRFFNSLSKLILE